MLFTNCTLFSRQGQGITELNALMPLPSGTTVVEFHSNQISNISDDYFDHVASTLSGIHLEGNWLEIITTLMFQNLILVRFLHLQNNRIHTIHPYSFKNMTTMTALVLYNNQLRSIPECVLDLVDHPLSLTIYINNNPLMCDEMLCYLLPGQTEGLTVDSPSSVICSGPADLEGKTLDSLTTNDICTGDEPGIVQQPIS